MKATGLVPTVIPALVQSLLTLIVVAAALLLYDRTVVRPALRIGMVDVAEVYRQKAMLMVRAFAQRLPIALEELPRDCSCLVVLKGAVAGPTPHTVDLTALLRQKVGMP